MCAGDRVYAEAGRLCRGLACAPGIACMPKPGACAAASHVRRGPRVCRSRAPVLGPRVCAACLRAQDRAPVCEPYSAIATGPSTPKFASTGKAHASHCRCSVATRMNAIAARTPNVAKPSW
jgi:hypothetical protein